MRIKKSYVAGMFYPNDSKDITKMIEYFNSIPSHDINCPNLQAMIVPHAGYIYSGFSANLAIKKLQHRDIKTVIVIGPSHKVYFEGISIADYDKYETPFGDLTIDTRLVDRLQREFNLPFYKEAHQEHSTEVQMPFVKYYLPNVKVVELVYSHIEASVLSKIMEFCFNDTTIGLISSDLSHFYDINKAKELDSICLKAIDLLDEELLHQGCEACGKLGIEALLLYAKKRGLVSHILDYRTSADITKDKREVVGYTSAIFCKE